MTYTETNLAATIEQLAGDELAALTQPQLDGIDQFHSGGAEAVDRLLPSLGLTPAMTALDVGSGLGGPARQVARSTGCAVVGVDITPVLRRHRNGADSCCRAVGTGRLHVCRHRQRRARRLRRGVHHARPDERRRQAGVLHRDCGSAPPRCPPGDLRGLSQRAGRPGLPVAVVDRRHGQLPGHTRRPAGGHRGQRVRDGRVGRRDRRGSWTGSRGSACAWPPPEPRPRYPRC